MHHRPVNRSRRAVFVIGVLGKFDHPLPYGRSSVSGFVENEKFNLVKYTTIQMMVSTLKY